MLFPSTSSSLRKKIEYALFALQDGDKMNIFAVNPVCERELKVVSEKYRVEAEE